MKALAMGRDIAPADDPRFVELGDAEARRIWEMSQAEIVREIYFRADRSDAVLVLELAHLDAARAAVDSLPLVAAELIEFDLVPLRPYPGLERLFRKG